MLFPNLIGNAPDWDRIAEIAARHDLPVIEDSCDTLGPTLARPPTGERSTISVTSFANSHIITAAGNGGMVMVDDDECARPRRHAAPVGAAVRGQLLRLEAARARLLGGPRRHPLRQPVHLRRGRRGTSSRRSWARRSGSCSWRSSPSNLAPAAAQLRRATPSSSPSDSDSFVLPGSSPSSRPPGWVTR